MRSVWTYWQTWALLSALFAALTAVTGKVGVERVDPNYATLLRTIVILVFLAALVLATNSAQPLGAISAKGYAFLALSGLFTGFSWLCYFRALKLGPAAQVAPVDKLSVVFVAVLAVLFLGETLSIRNWIGVALIAGGAALVATKG